MFASDGVAEVHAKSDVSDAANAASAVSVANAADAANAATTATRGGIGKSMWGIHPSCVRLRQLWLYD